MTNFEYRIKSVDVKPHPMTGRKQYQSIVMIGNDEIGFTSQRTGVHSSRDAVQDDISTIIAKIKSSQENKPVTVPVNYGSEKVTVNANSSYASEIEKNILETNLRELTEDPSNPGFTVSGKRLVDAEEYMSADSLGRKNIAARDDEKLENIKNRYSEINQQLKIEKPSVSVSESTPSASVGTPSAPVGTPQSGTPVTTPQPGPDEDIGGTGVLETTQTISGVTTDGTVTDYTTPTSTGVDPITGVYTSATQTGDLSALPPSVTYATNTTGTPGNVPDYLLTPSTSSGQGGYTVKLPSGKTQNIPYGQPLPPGSQIVSYYQGEAPNIPNEESPVNAYQGGMMSSGYSPGGLVDDAIVKIAQMNGFQGSRPQEAKMFMNSSEGLRAKARAIGAMMNKGGLMSQGYSEGAVATTLADFQKQQQDLVSGTMSPMQPGVSTIQPQAEDFIPTDAGQTAPIAPFAEAATVGTTAQAELPTPISTVTADPTAVSSEVQAETGKLTAAQGEVSNIINAAQQETSSVSGMEVALGDAIKVDAPDAREIQEGEIISGVADATKAAKFTEAIQAAEATPSKQATVAGQLEGLMNQFEGGNTPPWAAGSMRQAMATMAARGLGASSTAGQAIIQAAMEAALPIAQMDAQTQAQFESQNLSNRQQRAMLAAQQRAQFLGQEFDQAFQARVQNASRIADIANMNFTAEQQIALEDARAANTMELSNLSNRQAMVMAEAAALANLDMANLSNRQQTAVQNAQNFLQMDMANLSNRQQTEMFKSQQNIQALFTDAAAENAFAQFNAANENQVNQFFASLANQTSQFNATQRNAMDQFNVNSVNALREFNSGLQQQRDLFNAQNGLVVAQANAQWRQNIATINNAAQNESNMAFAQVINALTSTNLDAIWQRERDILSMAFQVSEGNADRANSIILQKMAADASIDVAELQAKIQAAGQEGNFLSDLFTTIIGLG